MENWQVSKIARPKNSKKHEMHCNKMSHVKCKIEAAQKYVSRKSARAGQLSIHGFRFSASVTL